MLLTKRVLALILVTMSLLFQVGCRNRIVEAITFAASAVATIGVTAARLGCGVCGLVGGVAFGVQVIGVIVLADLSTLDTSSSHPDPNFGSMAVVNPVRFTLTNDPVIDQSLIAGGKLIDDSRMIKMSLQKYYGAVAAQNTLAAQLQRGATCSSMSNLNADLQTFSTTLSGVSARFQGTPAASLSVTAADINNFRQQTVYSQRFPEDEAKLFGEANVTPDELSEAFAAVASVTDQDVADLGNLTGVTIFSAAAQMINRVNASPFLPQGFTCDPPPICAPSSFTALSLERAVPLAQVLTTLTPKLPASTLAAITGGALEIREQTVYGSQTGTIISNFFLVPTGSPLPSSASVITAQNIIASATVQTSQVLAGCAPVSSLLLVGTTISSAPSGIFGATTGAPVAISLGYTSDSPPRLNNVSETVAGVVTVWSAGATGTLTFSAPSPTGVTIKVTGPGGATSATNTFTTVSNQIRLNASLSTSSNAGELTYSWTPSPGYPSVAIIGGNTSTPTFQLLFHGTYQSTLTVTDATGLKATTTITMSYI